MQTIPPMPEKKQLNLIDSNNNIVIPVKQGFVVFPVGEVLYCSSDGNYTNFHLSDGNKLIAIRTLKLVETSLMVYGFFRIHRMHIINLKHLKEYRFAVCNHVLLINETKLEVSLRKKKELVCLLNKTVFKTLNPKFDTLNLKNDT